MIDTQANWHCFTNISGRMLINLRHRMAWKTHSVNTLFKLYQIVLHFFVLKNITVEAAYMGRLGAPDIFAYYIRFILYQ